MTETLLFILGVLLGTAIGYAIRAEKDQQKRRFTNLRRRATMANFVGPGETKGGYHVFINVDLVTDFLYDNEDDVTVVNFVAEGGSREFSGNLTGLFVQNGSGTMNSDYTKEGG